MPFTTDAPIKACVALDRFCAGCGYNLRTLSIARDRHTQILVVRCPECGRYEAADGATVASAWLRRVTSLMLIVWMLGIFAAIFGLCAAEGTVSMGTLEGLTTWEQVKVPAAGNGVRTTTRIVTKDGNTTTTVMHQQRCVPPGSPYCWSFVSLMLAASAGIAFAAGTMGVIAIPYWPRRAYVVLAIAMPLLVGGITACAWAVDVPHLRGWSLPYLGAHVGMQIVGGLAAVALGRPLARQVVRSTLPPSVRSRLAYLWLADRKDPPPPTRVASQTVRRARPSRVEPAPSI